MLIGLHGKKQAGKDTVHQRMEHLVDTVPVERVSFADLLYESAAAALGITVEQLRVWKSEPVYVTVTAGPHRTLFSQSVREFLQRYGTEAHRSIFGDNFWVDNVNIRDHGMKLVVVTDVRFPNEAQAVRDAGGKVVRVVGPPAVEYGTDSHVSEDTLPSELIDAELYNHIRNDWYRNLDAEVLSVLEAFTITSRL